MNDRNVPEAEVNLDILNGSYRESRPSELKRQGLQSALSGPLETLKQCCRSEAKYLHGFNLSRMVKGVWVSEVRS